MVVHRISAAVLAASLGIGPVAAPPGLSPTSAVADRVPCPVAAPPPAGVPPHPVFAPPDPAAPVIGGPELASTGLVVPAGSPPLPGVLTARAWLVADLDTGAVLGACAPHVKHPPASVQKLLLAATVLPKLDPQQVVEVTPADLDIERGSSAVGLLPGGRYSIETLWLGLLLVSGNDAANVLARLGGGEAGVPGALQEMNDFARGLGAEDTDAHTPHGLDSPGQSTSVYDLALIARACVDREDFRRYALTRQAQIPPQPPKDPRGFQIQNENQLVNRYPGALGGKTGFTTVSRHTYVGAAERDGHRLVATLLHAEANPARGWQQGAALLDWGFAVTAQTGTGGRAGGGQPPTGGIGRLVAPGEVEAARRAPAATRQPAAAGQPGTGQRAPVPDWRLQLVVVAGGALAVIAVALLLNARARTRAAEGPGDDSAESAESDPPGGSRAGRLEGPRRAAGQRGAARSGYRRSEVNYRRSAAGTRRPGDGYRRS